MWAEWVRLMALAAAARACYEMGRPPRRPRQKGTMSERPLVASTFSKDDQGGYGGNLTASWEPASVEVRDAPGLPPRVREWKRRELRRFREAQERKWRRWTEAMYE